MPAIEMFKFKQVPQHVLDNNPIMQQFEIGRQVGSAGPELIWKIYEAIRRTDKKESSVFVFEKKLAEKLHKPRRKETITEILRQGVKELERFKHPKLLNVLHPVEESSETLAFATEPVMGSLANLIACNDDKTQSNLQVPVKSGPEYTFMDIEIKYGILQVTEALCFLHYMGQVIHRNVSPQSIIVNKRGTWKLAGLEFIERANSMDVMVPITCHPWTSKIAKMAQSDLDYTAPEVQITSTCSPLSDMFSLGMLICAIFNKGKSLIEANHSSSTYLKHLEMLEENLNSILDKIPRPLQEPVQKLLSKGSKQRPSAQLFSLTKYFSDSVVHTLQYLDLVQMKDATQKAHFYINLRDMIYLIPKKLWFQHVFPSLQQEIQSQEVLAAALQPILVLIQESTAEEYLNIILPSIRCLFSMPKSIQSTVTLLENLQILLEKTPDEDIKSEILPMLYSAFDSATPQVQCAALQAVASIADYLDEAAIRKMVLPRAKTVFTKTAGLKSGDVDMQSKVLACIEKIIDKLEKTTLLDEVLPMLAEVKLQDPSILMTVVNIYKQLLSDKKYGLTVNLIATKVLPSLTPQMVNPALDLDNFTLLMGVVQEMFYQVDRNQRNKLKLDNLTLPVNDNERKKTSSSVEDVVRRDSNSSDSNFLRVQAAFNSRRHSDNALLIPHIQVNPSSPDGGSPTGFAGNFPIRRHSSVGPPEAKYLQQQRTSLTNSFLNAAPSTFKGGRRFSACVTTGLGGSQQQGLLQQLGSGVAQLFSGK
ncbi:hypothetical protein CHUAL_013097 [Chamberlinius hualienensis]